jgi:flagellar biosynthesis protein FliR
MLEQWLITGIYTHLLVFSRIGAALFAMPLFGDRFLPTQTRLILGLAITVLVTPLLMGQLPPMPGAPSGLLLLLGGEIFIGIFIGTAARIVFETLDVASQIIAQQTGLASALSFNPALGTQATIVTTFLATLGLMIIFATQTHYLLLEAIVGSYGPFPAGQMPMSGDMLAVIASLIDASFVLGLKLAAPFMVIGIVFFLGLALVARLQPQLQVFLVALPLQVCVGLLLLGLTLSAMMTSWLKEFEAALLPFLGSG